MDTVGAAPPKLSSAKSVGFRPGALRGQLEALLADLQKRDPNARLSDILRDGVTAFWPQIEAFIRARTESRVSPEQLTKIVLVSASALQNGMTVDELETAILDAIEEKIAALPERG